MPQLRLDMVKQVNQKINKNFNKDIRRLWSFWYNKILSYNKHQTCSTSGQININIHTKDLFALNLLPYKDVFQQNITRHTGCPEKSEETKQSLESNLIMAQMLKLSNRAFAITVSNMLKGLKEKVDNMHEYLGNVSREIKSKRSARSKNQ